MCSTFPKTKSISCSNSFDWNLTEILSLTHSLIQHFETVPNSKKLHKTTEKWQLKDFKIQIARKTLCKKVKLLILSNFTFFYNVFPKLFFLECVKKGIYGGKG